MEFHQLSKHEQLDVVIDLKTKLVEAQQQRDHLERENAKQGALLNSVVQQRDELLAALEKIAEVCNGYDLEAGWACRHAREAIRKVKP